MFGPLDYIFDTLDKPRRAVVGGLAGRPREMLNLLPFSDALGITDPNEATSGRDLLETYGMLDPNQEGLDTGDVAGFGVDQLLDPLNWLGGLGLVKGAKYVGRAKQLGKAVDQMGPALREAGQAAKGAEKAEQFFGSLAKHGPQFAEHAQQSRQAQFADELFSPMRSMVERPALPAPTPPFYSRMDEAIEGLQGERFKTQGLQNRLMKHPEGVSPEEMQWRELNYPLSKKPVITKDELRQHAKENPLDVRRIEKRELSAAEQAKMDELTEKARWGDGSMWSTETSRERNRLQAMQPKWKDYTVPEGQNYREFLLQAGNKTPMQATQPYKSPHFDEENILAHIRTTDRTLPNGKKMLLVEELQSDWFQGKLSPADIAAHEKKMGALQETARQAHKVERMLEYGSLSPREAEAVLNDMIAKSGPMLQPEDVADMKGWLAKSKYHGDVAGRLKGEAEDAANALAEKLFASAALPEGPFSKNWHELGIKHVLDIAAKEGYDAVGFNTGKTVRKLVGGKSAGQNKFYDETIPNTLKKYFKSRGWGKVDLKDAEMTVLDTGAYGPTRKTFGYRYFTVPQQVKRSIFDRGQPLMSLGPLGMALGAGAYGMQE